MLAVLVASCLVLRGQEEKKSDQENKRREGNPARRSPESGRGSERGARRSERNSESGAPAAQRAPEQRQVARPQTSGEQPRQDRGSFNRERQAERTQQEPGRSFPRSREPFSRPNPPSSDRFGGHPADRSVDRSPMIRTGGGGMVRRDTTGRVREVHTPGGAVIVHRPDGVRRVEVARPGDRVVVAIGRGHGGYVQRPIVVSNREYVQRTYYVRGAAYTRFYRPVMYGGIRLHVYTPVRYYRPSFYLWAYNPWARPVIFSWGWAGSPWYVYYGGYFAPYPSYVGPSYWLTDYFIAATLRAAYEERMEAAAAARANSYAYDSQAVLTPEVKQLISDEVRRQLELERAEGQSVTSGSSYPLNDAQPIFAGNGPRVFVVSDTIEVSGPGQDCTISEGDVLQLNGAPPANSTTADVVVLASKGRDCRKGSLVSVQLQDLQEMQNNMRATVDMGLQDLQSRQGQAGIPALPASAGGTVDSPLASNVRPDTNVADELSQTAQEADRGEQYVVDQNVRSGTPVRIALGQTIEEVVATEGQPQKVVDLGARKIYIYRDMKITFIDGKVNDVQ